MKFKVFFDELTNTVTITEDDSGPLILFLLLAFAAFCNVILPYLSFAVFSILLIVLAKKLPWCGFGAFLLAIGSAIIGIVYCVLITQSILHGTDTTAFIVILLAISIFTSAYSIKFSKKREKGFLKNWNAGETQSSRGFKLCKIAKHVSIVTIVLLLAFFAGLLIVDAPSPEETREAMREAEFEAQLAESVSLWKLDIVESDAIYGIDTKYDSYGNAYYGEYREFCAWKYPSRTFEPCVIVDINEKYEYTRFTGTIFTRPDQDDSLAITFQIFADDTCIYDSGELHASTPAIDLDLDVDGVDQLKFLAFTDSHDSTNPAVILANAVLHAD